MTVAPFPVDENGDIIVWKAIAAGRESHLMKRPLFRNHGKNYSLDKGVAIRIKAFGRPTGTFPLSSEYARRKEKSDFQAVARSRSSFPFP